MTRAAPAALGLIASIGLGACGSSGPSGTHAGSGTHAASGTHATAGAALAAGCRPTASADQTVLTPSHVFLLHVGREERMVMLSAAQARSRHVTSGELMVGGSMAAMPAGTTTGHPTTRHLEVHICDRGSGRVLTGAVPTITLAPASGGAPERVAVAAMQGIGAGAADLHYGNNVALRPGTSYRITLGLGADRAAFTYRVPRGT